MLKVVCNLGLFHQQLGSSLKGPLEAFKAARLFPPYKQYTMQRDATTVDSLSAFPLLADAIAGLMTEKNKAAS